MKNLAGLSLPGIIQESNYQNNSFNFGGLGKLIGLEVQNGVTQLPDILKGILSCICRLLLDTYKARNMI